MPKLYLLILLLLLAGGPVMAQAHEVYVLGAPIIQHDVDEQSPNPFAAVSADPWQFVVSGVIGVILILVVLWLSRWPRFQRICNPRLDRLKPYAPLAGRLTLGVSLLSSAHYAALFGPELSLTDLTSLYANWLQLLLYVLGGLVLIGLFTRLSALISIIIYFWAANRFGSYLVTYLNYLGEMLLVLMVGSQTWSVDAMIKKPVTVTKVALEKYSFIILRICFGIALLFASFFAKFWHSQLALDTVIQYHLTQFFPFDPLFIVLGAFLTETLIGLFFLIGFQIRFTALVFIGFLILSIAYFGEVVWPHLILFGVNIALFLHGYDNYTIGRRLFSRNGQDPVL